MRYVDGFVLPVPKKNLKAYFPPGQEGRNDLEGTRRAGIPRMRW
jgi:hypothetical protein